MGGNIPNKLLIIYLTDTIIFFYGKNCLINILKKNS